MARAWRTVVGRVEPDEQVHGPTGGAGPRPDALDEDDVAGADRDLGPGSVTHPAPRPVGRGPPLPQRGQEVLADDAGGRRQTVPPGVDVVQVQDRDGEAVVAQHPGEPAREGGLAAPAAAVQGEEDGPTAGEGRDVPAHQPGHPVDDVVRRDELLVHARRR